MHRFLDKMRASGTATSFVLHGHGPRRRGRCLGARRGTSNAGTGALKRGLREFLRSDARVKSAAPAAHEDGGDAFTQVTLRVRK